MKIFDQFLNDFQYLGIFGNAATNHGQDWTKTLGLEDAAKKVTEPGSFNDFKKSCKNFASSLEVEILTSQVGSED